ncbi:hypothetical protein WJX73_004045 [Symbiochloris irregularis]|uniref:Treble clef zinc finger domain-containing protein n=1 Tax=Symbiochloris irregularis TaxID=706552 RepID=A0AAW1NMD0_9CHLO
MRGSTQSGGQLCTFVDNYFLHQRHSHNLPPGKPKVSLCREKLRSAPSAVPMRQRLRGIHRITPTSAGHPTLREARPDLVAQVHPDKNQGFPELAREWSSRENKDMRPNDMLPGSETKVWWDCKAHGPYKASPQKRVYMKTGCPDCGRENTARNQTRHGTLAQERPELAQQWHPTRNGPMTPSDVTLGSVRLFWWLCTESRCEHTHECLVDEVNSASAVPHRLTSGQGTDSSLTISAKEHTKSLSPSLIRHNVRALSGRAEVQGIMMRRWKARDNILAGRIGSMVELEAAEDFPTEIHFSPCSTQVARKQGLSATMCVEQICTVCT